MNLKLTFCLALVSSGIMTAQTNTYPATGNIPLNMPASTPANFNLQLHGNTDYSVTVPDDPNTGGSGYTTAYGKTSRFGMTNTTTGLASTDGMLFRMSGLNFVMENLEKKDLTLTTGSLSLLLSGTHNRIFLGQAPSSSTAYGRFNIRTSNENGMYIRTSAGKYGLTIRNANNDDVAIQVLNNTGANNFSVKASGETTLNYPVATNSDKVLTISNATRKLLQLTNDGILKTREVNVDLIEWPDYVFAPSYRLMPLKEVNSFIKANGHLPNIPKADVIEAGGLNVGDMTKILMEKVEELTLYLIEQQNLLEKQQAEINALKAAK